MVCVHNGIAPAGIQETESRFPFCLASFVGRVGLVVFYGGSFGCHALDLCQFQFSQKGQIESGGVSGLGNFVAPDQLYILPFGVILFYDCISDAAESSYFAAASVNFYADFSDAFAFFDIIVALCILSGCWFDFGDYVDGVVLRHSDYLSFLAGGGGDSKTFFHLGELYLSFESRNSFGGSVSQGSISCLAAHAGDVGCFFDILPALRFGAIGDNV